MIKTPRLLFAVLGIIIMSAVSALAFLGNPMLMGGAPSSAPPPGTIACDIGPNYIGSIPAGASAAGFTRCAYNLDVTQFTSTSQFLGCPTGSGSSTPIAWALVFQMPTDCSSFTVVSDSGANALRLHIPSGTVTNGSQFGLAVGTADSAAPTVGQIFPTTKYLEIRARWQGSDGLCGNNNCDLQGAFTYRLNPDPGSSFPWFEWDDWECYTITTTQLANGFGPGDCEQTIHTQNGSTSVFVMAAYNNTASGSSGRFGVALDVTTMHTYGMRLVADGIANLTNTTSGNFTWCSYHDGSLDHCFPGTYGNVCGGTCSQDLFQFREWLPFEEFILSAITLPHDMDLYIQRVTYWECPTWNTGTSVLPGRGPLAEKGNNCLNTTADVTGKLAGAP